MRAPAAKLLLVCPTLEARRTLAPATPTQLLLEAGQEGLALQQSFAALQQPAAAQQSTGRWPTAAQPTGAPEPAGLPSSLGAPATDTSYADPTFIRDSSYQARLFAGVLLVFAPANSLRPSKAQQVPVELTGRGIRMTSGGLATLANYSAAPDYCFLDAPEVVTC